MPRKLTLRWQRCRRCAWRSLSGAATRRASSSCRAAGSSSALSPARRKPASRQGFRESCRNPGYLRYSPLHQPGPQSACQGVGRELKNHALASTISKVGKSDGEGTFAGARGNDEVAPIAAVHRDGLLATKAGLSTRRGSGQWLHIPRSKVLAKGPQAKPGSRLVRSSFRQISIIELLVVSCEGHRRLQHYDGRDMAGFSFFRPDPQPQPLAPSFPDQQLDILFAAVEAVTAALRP